MKNLIVFTILLLSVAGTSQKVDLNKIDAIVNSKIGENDPGLFVGIVKDGEIVYEHIRGLANLQHQIKADGKTRSNIASTAKQFTALMILKLSLEKKISLEDDIRKYLPTLYPNIKETIKIRHLINHTSGIRDVYDLMSIQQNPWWRNEGLDNDDAIELLKKQEDLAFTPGSRYLYSNSGYIILTKIIAQASEMPFHKYSKAFFETLGMQQTAFLKNYMHVIPNKAYPYSDWGDGVWQEYPMMTNLYGDGFLFTTLKDQLHFEQAIQNAQANNNTLLIESQKVIPGSEIQTYGFGLELEDRLNYKAVHHSGGTGSYHSQVVRFPSEQLSVFVMSTNSRIWSGAIADEIASLLLPQKELKDTYDARIKETSRYGKISEVIGQYLSPDDYLVRIEQENDKLYWKNANNNPFEISQEKKNIYAIVANPKIKIGFYKDECVLFYPSGKTFVYKRNTIKVPNLSDLKALEGSYYSKELEVNFSLKLSADNKLMISRKEWRKDREIEVLNSDELLVRDYILKIKRDRFNKVEAILVTTNRVLNNKFVKQSG